MRTVIAGGHGKIALRLERLLAERGDGAVGLIRNPAQADDLRAAGAEPVVLDLESSTVEQVVEVLRGADAAVFAAGAGAGSGADRKQTVDRDAAVLLADAAERAGVRRFLVVSSMGADADADHPDPVFRSYLRAKGAADDAVRAHDALDWTILRPGALTDDARHRPGRPGRHHRPRLRAPRRRRRRPARPPGRPVRGRPHPGTDLRPEGGPGSGGAGGFLICPAGRYGGQSVCAVAARGAAVSGPAVCGVARRPALFRRWPVGGGGLHRLAEAGSERRRPTEGFGAACQRFPAPW